MRLSYGKHKMVMKHYFIFKYAFEGFANVWCETDIMEGATILTITFLEDGDSILQMCQVEQTDMRKVEHISKHFKTS